MTRRAFALALALLAAPAAVQAQQTPIKIGFISSYTGPEAGTTRDISDGWKLAIKLMDNKMAGRPVEIVYGDDQFKPDIGRQLVDKMVQSDKVQIITGINGSNVMLAAYKPALDAGVFVISNNAGPSQIAGKGCQPLFFSASHQNDTFYEAVGQLATHDKVPTAYLVAANYPAGRDMLGGFKRTYNGQVVGETYTGIDQLDYANVIADIRAKKPAAVVVFLPGNLGLNFTKQYAAAGMGDVAPIYSGAGLGDQVTLPGMGDAALGMRIITNWSEQLDNKPSRAFTAAFEKEYNRIPSPFAAVAYDSAQIIAAALRTIGGRIEDKVAFQHALETVKVDSVRGNFAFNTNHFPIQNMYEVIVGKNPQGQLVGNLKGTAVVNLKDHYAPECKMPAQ